MKEWRYRNYESNKKKMEKRGKMERRWGGWSEQKTMNHYDGRNKRVKEGKGTERRERKGE